MPAAQTLNVSEDSSNISTNMEILTSTVPVLYDGFCGIFVSESHCALYVLSKGHRKRIGGDGLCWVGRLVVFVKRGVLFGIMEGRGGLEPSQGDLEREPGE